MFTYSTAGEALTKRFEGLRLQAYQDVGGTWTIGYGHTGPDVHVGLVWTEAQACAALEQDVAESVACVNTAVLPLGNLIAQHQFDALVDFCFNCGRGNFLHSTLLRLVSAGNLLAAVAQFGLWVHAGAMVEPGLVQRRKAEALLFLGEEETEQTQAA